MTGPFKPLPDNATKAPLLNATRLALPDAVPDDNEKFPPRKMTPDTWCATATTTLGVWDDAELESPTAANKSKPILSRAVSVELGSFAVASIFELELKGHSRKPKLLFVLDVLLVELLLEFEEKDDTLADVSTSWILSATNSYFPLDPLPSGLSPKVIVTVVTKLGELEMIGPL